MSDRTTLTDTELLRDLGIELPPHVEALRRRAVTGRAGVAVVGLFSRGKSTLFNNLVGATVAQAGALPTTKLMTEASTGQRFAAAFWADRSKQLPLDADAFVESIAALEEPYPDRVEISGPFRLPAGMHLIDTPGAGAVSSLNEREWYLSGAGAAVLVLAFPPGPQGEDWELLGSLQEVFGDNTAVALKATSSDVTDDELAEVTTRAEANSGRPIIVLPTQPPNGGWAQDPAWAPVEEAITELELKARHAGASAPHDLRAWLDTRLAQLEASELSATGRSLVLAESMLSPGLSPTAIAAIKRVGDQVRAEHEQGLERDRLEREAETARRLELVRPRQMIGEAILRDCDRLRFLPYETLRAELPATRALLLRLERWKEGNTESTDLAGIQRAVDAAHQVVLESYACLEADDLLERVQSHDRIQRMTPLAGYAHISMWMADTERWLTSVTLTNPTVDSRRQSLMTHLTYLRDRATTDPRTF